MKQHFVRVGLLNSIGVLQTYEKTVGTLGLSFPRDFLTLYSSVLSVDLKRKSGVQHIKNEGNTQPHHRSNSGIYVLFVVHHHL